MRHIPKAYLIAIVCLGVHSDGHLLQGLLGGVLGIVDRHPLTNLVSTPVGGIEFGIQAAEYKHKQPADVTPEQNEEYDFIVVGAGSAGAAVAARLSEIPDATVLLLEAGGDEKLIYDIPLTVHYQQLNKAINWGYRTQPSDDFCLAMEDKRCNWPRGKVMGGTSVLNYMIATRGNCRDYDQWAELGNEGWSCEEVLYYFKKLENIGIPELRSDTAMHNTEGPVNISYPVYHTKLATSFLDAVGELGIPQGDYNGRDQYRASYLQTTTVNGARVSSNTAYLTPIRDRSNLYVSKYTLASKVLIDGIENRAYGVEFKKNGVTHIVKARKEVIVSAGAIGTPQILMLSGIGPAEHLEGLGIPVIKDAPVGDNLMDHIAYGGFVVLVNESVSIISSDILNPLKPHLSDYFLHRKGPLSVTGGCEAVAFVNTDTPGDHRSSPDVELLFLGASILSEDSAREGLGFTDTFWKKTYEDFKQHHSWSMYPMLMRPKSKGRIRLEDNNIDTHPLIYPNYLSHPADMEVLINGIRAAQSIMETPAMKKYGSKFLDVHIPGCEDHTYDSDDYWACAIRHMTLTIYHPSGTAKMGPEGDPTAVVNPRLQVHGIKGLRVADASIMPEIMTGHTNIPTIMIGEKAADMVKEDWGYPTDKS